MEVTFRAKQVSNTSVTIFFNLGANIGSIFAVFSVPIVDVRGDAVTVNSGVQLTIPYNSIIAFF